MLKPECIKYFPKTLKNVILPPNLVAALIDEYMYDLWPTQLEELCLRNASEITGACLMCLPRTIKYLYIPDMKQVVDSDLAFLPPCLMLLDLSAATELTEHGISLLPTTLETIILRNTPIRDFSVFKRFGSLKFKELSIKQA